MRKSVFEPIIIVFIFVIGVLGVLNADNTRKSYTFKHRFPKEPSKKVQVEYMAHGDTSFVLQPDLCGTIGESRRLEGFLIRSARGDINLEYMAHIQGMGDTGWKYIGTFIGTKGCSLRLEGFAIQVTPDYADKYDVYYMAHLKGTGDTPWFKNGEFCGTRGQSRRVEAIAVFISDKKDALTGVFSESLPKRYYFPECQTQIPSPEGWHAYNNTKSLVGFVSVLKEKATGPGKKFKTGLSFYTNYDKTLKANVNDTESLAEISFSALLKKLPANVGKKFYYLEGKLGKFKFLEITPGNPYIPIIAVGVIKNYIGGFQVIIGSPPDLWNDTKPILIDMVKNIKVIMASRPGDEVVYSQMGYPHSWVFKQRDNRQRKNLLERFGNLKVGMDEEKYKEIMKYDLKVTGLKKVNKTPGWIMRRPALNEDCYVDLYGVDILCICEELFYVHIKNKKIKDFKLLNRTLPDDVDTEEWENVLVRIPGNKNEYNGILKKIEDWTTIPNRAIRAVERLKRVKTGMSEQEYLTIAKGFILRFGGGGVIRVVPGVHEFFSSFYNKKGINAEYIYAFRKEGKVVPLGKVIIREGIVQEVIIEKNNPKVE